MKKFEQIREQYLNKFLVICNIKFLKHRTDFHKNHNTQNALLVLTEKWKSSLNKKLKVGSLFMDLFIDHSLLLAKLSQYGFDNNSLSLAQSYLTNRFQRCMMIENYFSKWHKIISGVPQSSILKSPIFNIMNYTIFLFVESTYVCNYGNTLITLYWKKNVWWSYRKLQNDFLNLDKCFFNNFLVLNSGKCQFLTLETLNTWPNFKCKYITIKNSASNFYFW